MSKDENCVPHATYNFPLKSDAFPTIDNDTSISVKFFIQKSPNVHKSMLLNGAVLKPRALNDMDLEVMRRHATTHDRINNLNWNRNGDRSNGYNQQSGGGHMRSYPPTPTPGVPPSNVAAVQWYHQTNMSFGSQIGGAHVSGVLRLQDLQAQFGNVSGASGEPRGYYSQPPTRTGHYGQGGYGQQDRGHGDRGHDQRGGYGDRGGNNQGRRGGSGYYQNQDGRYGSGSGYRDNRGR